MADGDDWIAQRDDMKSQVFSYKPWASDLLKTNIVLVGSVGSGKSSMVNTVDSALKGRLAARAENLSSAHSVTKQFRRYDLGGRQRSLGFSIWDTMGMEEEKGLELTDLIYVLDGNVPDKFIFDHVLITPSTHGFVPGYELHRKMHCVVYVMDATSVSFNSSDTRDKCKRLHSLSKARKLKMVVLLTHIDSLSQEVFQDPGRANTDRAIQRAIQSFSRQTGVPASDIFPIRNYASDSQTDAATDVLTLTALIEMLNSANQYFRDTQK